MQCSTFIGSSSPGLLFCAICGPSNPCLIAGIYGYSGPSIAFPSRIQNCEFINLYRGGVSGVGIEFTTVGTSANWLIQNNRFEGTKQGIYLNAGPSYPNNGISVINNYFTK